MAKKLIVALLVTSLSPRGFRRCGMAFTREATLIEKEALTDAELKTLLSEPNLKCEEVEVDPDSITLTPSTATTGTGAKPGTTDGAGTGSTPDVVELSLEQIVEAIGSLDADDEKLWTKEKGPKPDALTKVLKQKVSAEQRDQAWVVFQEQNQVKPEADSEAETKTDSE